MANTQNVTDTFSRSTCSVCGGSEINQYFSISGNFIEYCGIFHSFQDILAEALDFHVRNNFAIRRLFLFIQVFNSQISDSSETTNKICLDCKDKVVKFYHFKRKVKEVQNQIVASKKQNQPKSKVVHKILDIVRNFSDKYSISSIQVDENNRKLVIAPAEKAPVASSSAPDDSAPIIVIKQEPTSDGDEILWQPSEPESPNIPDVVIKEEPQEFPIIFNIGETFVKPKQRSRSSTTDDESFSNLSRSALKMREYRARLKRPENLHRYLHHQQQQREWNKRHYLKKQQIESGKSGNRRNRNSLCDFT